MLPSTEKLIIEITLPNTVEGFFSTFGVELTYEETVTTNKNLIKLCDVFITDNYPMAEVKFFNSEEKFVPLDIVKAYMPTPRDRVMKFGIMKDIENVIEQSFDTEQIRDSGFNPDTFLETLIF